LSVQILKTTLFVTSLAGLAVACSGDSGPAPVAPLSVSTSSPGYEPPADSAPPVSANLAADFTYTCDPAYTVRLKSASFGDKDRAFVDHTLTYTADVFKPSTSTIKDIYGPAEWKERIQAVPGRMLTIGPPEVTPENTIKATMAGITTGPGSTSIEIKAYVAEGTDPTLAACGTFLIYVERGNADQIVFTPVSGHKTPIDKDVDVTVSVRNDQNTRLPQSDLTFIPSGGAAVTVLPQNDSVFRVDPQAQGDALINATFRGVTRAYTLKVCQPSTETTSLTLDPLPSLRVGQSAFAGATALNCVGQPRPKAWQSSDPGVATISSTGLITGVYPGTTTITVTSGALSRSRTLTVSPQQPYVQGSLVFDPGYPTGRAKLTWSSSVGAVTYKVYRTCRTSDGYSPGWYYSDATSSTNYETWDYVTAYAGDRQPEGAYFAYYVVASSANGGDSTGSTIVYFDWDDEAEPGC
jgi:hypothetical protein